MAQSREIIDEAWAGDIIGLHDTGTFAIGDTITEGEALNFKGIPSFAPQIFQIIRNANPDKEKQFHKGLNQLAEEGVIQIFSRLNNPNTKVLGVVSLMQLHPRGLHPCPLDHLRLLKEAEGLYRRQPRENSCGRPRIPRGGVHDRVVP
jgi:hypothetical protein